jgi:hypothetical protein
MTAAINNVSARSVSDSAKPQAIARSIGVPVTFYADAAFAGFAAPTRSALADPKRFTFHHAVALSSQPRERQFGTLIATH